MLTIDSCEMPVNGEVHSMDTAPQIQNGRTLVPVRFISEAMGAKVDWVSASRTVVISLGGQRLELVIGQTDPEMGLDVPALIVNGRTLVPLRYVSEALGATVNWYPESRSVEIVRY